MEPKSNAACQPVLLFAAAANGPPALNRMGPARRAPAFREEAAAASRSHARPQHGSQVPPPPRVGTRGAGGANSWSVRSGGHPPRRSTGDSGDGRGGQSPAAFPPCVRHGQPSHGAGAAERRWRWYGSGHARAPRVLDLWPVAVGAGWTAGVARRWRLVDAQAVRGAV